MLTALGVTLLAAGLLTYTTPVTAEAGAVPTAEPTASARPETPDPADHAPAARFRGAERRAERPADRVATRVRIAALDIDLPVVPPGDANDYPLCDVAMWIGALGQPGQGRATYLYAHAREGMFLPLLEQSKIKNGKKMLGMIVEVWTSDDQRFLYEITEVRRHQKTLEDAARGDRGGALAPDVRGPEGDASASPRSSPSRCRRRPPTTRRRTRRRSRWSAAEAAGRGSDPVDPAQEERGDRRDRDDERRHGPEPARLAAAERGARLAHPEDPGDRPDARPG